MKYAKIYGKSIKTKPQSKLNEDTMDKKQRSPERRRTYTKVRLSRCAAGKKKLTPRNFFRNTLRSAADDSSGLDA